MSARKVDYEDFRTGLTFGTVRQMLWVGSDDPKDWRYKRRGTVLGFWHQIKLQLYAEYEDRWEATEAAAAPGADDDARRQRAA